MQNHAIEVSRFSGSLYKAMARKSHYLRGARASSLFAAAAFGSSPPIIHQGLKLAQAHHEVAVFVHALDHAPTLLQRVSVFPERGQHAVQLLRGDEAVFVGVELVEGFDEGMVFGFFRLRRAATGLRVQMNELGEIQKAVAVAVHALDQLLQILLRRLIP